MDNGIKPDSPGIYQIRILEELGSEWSEWFGGFTVTQDKDNGSVLTGSVADQAALHGVIRKLRDLHLTLLSLHRIEIQSEKEKTS